MKITIEGASEQFAEKLLALVAEHRAELTVTADTDWTAERAERYLRALTGGARHFARLVVAGGGRADANQLREEFDRGLRGPTVALSRAMPRGVREGWWPEGTPAPIRVEYDPENPSWQRAVAYTMDAANVPLFREALRRVDKPPRITIDPSPQPEWQLAFESDSSHGPAWVLRYGVGGAAEEAHATTAFRYDDREQAQGWATGYLNDFHDEIVRLWAPNSTWPFTAAPTRWTAVLDDTDGEGETP
ncbi:hypothetical protein ACIP93_32925 [Streptomyces sp. NPDC088745]|uniref:hypothetical protein n=1 Tax=Streptomyces sp. NPDC088745 TaxID=3365884 RepID=UPI0037F95FEB